MFTEGKWAIDKNVIMDEKGKEIATISYRQDGYVKGNARLVAAAPELLAACQNLVRFAQPYTLLDTGIKRYCITVEDYRQIQAAILTAEKE